MGLSFFWRSKSFCYALSKHALEYLPADHKVWASGNVLINTVRVGLADAKFHKNDPTKNMAERVKMIPAGRMASPDEIAEIVFWYGSGQNTFITGEVISASSGE